MRVRYRMLLIATGLGLAAAGLIPPDEAWFETRVAVIEPGRIFRGAWQGPRPLRRILRRERIRTVVTLTAINRDDPKYVSQAGALEGSGVDWLLIPMRGSRASLEQMAEAADLVADPARQPVFFHCVGGHHRSSLVQAAYRIRHGGWTAERAWDEVSALPWARPGARADESDRRLIFAFAAAQRNMPRKDSRDEATTDPLGTPPPGRGGPGRLGVRHVEVGRR